MKLSELIAKLHAAIEEHGDLPVFLDSEVGPLDIGTHGFFKAKDDIEEDGIKRGQKGFIL
jgi:hypothetical protein